MATEFELNQINSIVDFKPKQEGIVEDNDTELKIPLSDQDFYLMSKKRIENAQAYWDKMGLAVKRRKNSDYWLGNQMDDVSLYRWQTPYIQNIIFRNVETLISNALGRLPSVVVMPGSDTVQSRNNAVLLQRKLRRDLDNPKVRRKMRQSLRHLLLLRLGVLKIRWDEKLCGGKGDRVWEFVHPDDILIDATTYLGNNPSLIVHYLEEPVKVIIAKFPEAKDKLFAKLGIKAGTESQLDKVIRYPEIWFTYYDEDGSPIEAVGWRYEEVVFKTMKAPYHNYEEMLDEQGQAVYRNFFESPRKPFVLLNFLSLGKHNMDDTTLVEQNLTLQDTVNKRGRQITQQSDTANGKWVFSSDFINKNEAEKVTDDPLEHIIGKGDVSRGAIRLAGQGPNQTLFAAKASDEESMDGLFGTHSPTRGGQSQNNTATSDVLSKQGDTTRIDDLVSEAIEITIGEMAEWDMQMIKLFYTEDHYLRDMGKDGKFVMQALSADLVEDGIEVLVKASSSDKDTRRSEAMELTKAQMIDPLSLFEDLDKDDPKERARRAILYATDPLKYQEEVLGMNTGDAGQVKKDIEMLKQGQQPTPPQSVTEEYMAGMADYLSQPEFKDLDPKIQAMFFTYVQSLKEMALKGQGGDQAGATVPNQPPIGGTNDQIQQ